MKRMLILLFSLSIVFASCTKSGESQANQQADEVRYFVKYVANGMANEYSVSYADADGRVSLNQIRESPFERTVGPVSRGFNASINIQCGYYRPPSVRIEVKKGDDPFVVKAESVGSAYVGASVSYVLK